MKEWVIITGATSGIGKALAIHFSKFNLKVLVIGRNEAALKTIANHSPNIAYTVMDLSQQHFFSNNHLGPNDKIRYLIHCAATCEPLAPVLEASENELNTAMRVNVLSPLILTQKLLSFFNKNTRILFFDSDYVSTQTKMHLNLSCVYSIAKTALDVAIAYLKKENPLLLIGQINPGSTDTPLFRKFIETLKRRNALFKPATPATPEAVTEFAFRLLTTTTNECFIDKKWDFRNQKHHEQLLMSSLTCKL